MDGTSAKTHGDDFVVTWPTHKLIGLKNKVAGVCPTKTKIICHGPKENITVIAWWHTGLR